MRPEKENPVALAGAIRVKYVKTNSPVIDRAKCNPDPLARQAAKIARRFGLSLPMARLVCQLAQIGGGRS